MFDLMNDCIMSCVKPTAWLCTCQVVHIDYWKVFAKLVHAFVKPRSLIVEKVQVFVESFKSYS